MISRREWLWTGVVGAAVLLALNLPYLWASLVAPAGHVFGGVLFAAPDGLSYLAKMRQGWRGEWLFTLPYTHQPGAGAFLFTYYLFLGHLARWTGASLEAIYHLARVANGALMLAAAYRFIGAWLESVAARRAAWLLFSLGSGLGWLAAAWLPLPPDWWIAESLPVLSLLSNAHFPLAWALTLLLLEQTLPGLSSAPLAARLLMAAGLTTLLAMVLPMALAPAWAALAGAAAWQAARRREAAWEIGLPPVVVAAAAAPWLANVLWLTAEHPLLSAWSAQNKTPSPSPLEALVWGGLPLLLAVRGAWRAARRRSLRDGVLLAWLASGIALIYAPLELQRRLSLGVWMPICLLALEGFTPLRPRWAWAAGGAAAGLSGLVVWLALFSAAQSGSAAVFLSDGEAAGIARLPAGALVLAAPETGQFIPARSDARVLYGHPFETVEADRRRQELLDYFAGRYPALLDRVGVQAVFYGPREAALGPRPDLPGWTVLWQGGGVSVYARP